MLLDARYALLTLCTVAAVACGAPGRPTTAPSDGARHADHAHGEQGSLHDEPASSENRDRHGPRDVEAYIARLEDQERVRGLQVDVVVESLALPDDAAIGDLGCGPGIFAVAFARAAPRGVVFAADVEPRQLDALRERAAQQGLDNVVPVLASYDAPHFPPAALDLIFIGDTLHHLPDRAVYLRALQRALKAGGRLALLEYKPGDLPVGPPAERKLGSDELERTLIEAGYVRVARFETHPYHDFEVWRVRQAWER